MRATILLITTLSLFRLQAQSDTSLIVIPAWPSAPTATYTLITEEILESRSSRSSKSTTATLTIHVDRTPDQQGYWTGHIRHTSPINIAYQNMGDSLARCSSTLPPISLAFRVDPQNGAWQYTESQRTRTALSTALERARTWTSEADGLTHHMALRALSYIDSSFSSPAAMQTAYAHIPLLLTLAWGDTLHTKAPSITTRLVPTPFADLPSGTNTTNTTLFPLTDPRAAQLERRGSVDTAPGVARAMVSARAAIAAQGPLDSDSLEASMEKQHFHMELSTHCLWTVDLLTGWPRMVMYSEVQRQGTKAISQGRSTLYTLIKVDQP